MLIVIITSERMCCIVFFDKCYRFNSLIFSECCGFAQGTVGLRINTALKNKVKHISNKVLE